MHDVRCPGREATIAQSLRKGEYLHRIFRPRGGLALAAPYDTFHFIYLRFLKKPGPGGTDPSPGNTTVAAWFPSPRPRSGGNRRGDRGLRFAPQ